MPQAQVHRLAPASGSLPPRKAPPERTAYRAGLVLTGDTLPALILTEPTKENGQPKLKLPQVELKPFPKVNLSGAILEMEKTTVAVRNSLADYLRFLGLQAHAELKRILPTVDVQILPPTAREAKKADEIHIIWAHYEVATEVGKALRSDMHVWATKQVLLLNEQSFRHYRQILNGFDL